MAEEEGMAKVVHDGAGDEEKKEEGEVTDDGTGDTEKKEESEQCRVMDTATGINALDGIQSDDGEEPPDSFFEEFLKDEFLDSLAVVDAWVQEAEGSDTEVQEKRETADQKYETEETGNNRSAENKRNVRAGSPERSGRQESRRDRSRDKKDSNYSQRRDRTPVSNRRRDRDRSQERRSRRSNLESDRIRRCSSDRSRQRDRRTENSNKYGTDRSTSRKERERFSRGSEEKAEGSSKERRSRDARGSPARTNMDSSKYRNDRDKDLVGSETRKKSVRRERQEQSLDVGSSLVDSPNTVQKVVEVTDSSLSKSSKLDTCIKELDLVPPGTEEEFKFVIPSRDPPPQQINYNEPLHKQIRKKASDTGSRERSVDKLSERLMPDVKKDKSLSF